MVWPDKIALNRDKINVKSESIWLTAAVRRSTRKMNTEQHKKKNAENMCSMEQAIDEFKRNKVEGVNPNGLVNT
ncbi:hypothetical protein WM54_07355 [Aeromonas veronii]|nr:hypothetical protein WM54_07355 [Aeromonas veronii]